MAENANRRQTALMSSLPPIGVFIHTLKNLDFIYLPIYKGTTKYALLY